MNQLLFEKSIGSADAARRVIQRASKEVKAYQRLLAEQGSHPDVPLDQLPVTDKAAYLTRYPFAELVGGDLDQSFTIFSSSGSSGQPFYWPQLKKAHATSADNLRQFLEAVFHIHKRRTLAVVGLALGSSDWW